MKQVRIRARDLRADDYLAGGIGRGPDTANRVRRVEHGDLHGRAVVIARTKGFNGVGAGKFLAPDDSVIVWR